MVALIVITALVGLGLGTYFAVVDWHTRGPRYLTTVGLSLTALILAGWLAWGYEPVRRPKGFETKRNRVAPDFKPAAVDRLRLTQGDRTIELQRAGKRWMITKPVRFPANADEVENILTEIKMLDRDKVLPGPRTDAQYGLRKPAAVVEVEGKGLAKLRLALGGEDITGSRIYLAKGTGKKVLVVGKHFLEAARKGLDNLRETRALDFKESETKSLTLTTVDGQRAQLFVDPRKVWTIRVGAEKHAQRANAKQADEMVRKLKDLRATRFLADGAAALAKHGLQSDAKLVAVDDGKAHRLWIGGPCDQHAGETKIGRRGKYPVVFCARRREVEELLVKVDALRDARLVGVDPADVKRLSIKAGADEIVLVKKGIDWEVEKPKHKGMKKADADQVEAFIKDLRSRSALAFLPPPAAGAGAWGLDKPQATLTLVTETGRTEKIELGKENEDKNFYARRSGEKVAIVVQRQVGSLFRPSLLPFRKLTVLSFGRNEAVEVTAQRGPVTEKVVLEGGVWQLKQPLALQTGRAFSDLLSALTQLKTERFVASSAEPQHGLATPTRTVSVKLEQQEYDKKNRPKTVVKTHTLRVGADTPRGGCYAQLAGDDAAVFVLAGNICTEMRQLLATKLLIDTSPAPIRELTLMRFGGREVLVKVKGEWRRKNGPKVKQALVERLLTGATRLRARRIIAYGAPAPTHGLATPRIRLELKKGEKDKPIAIRLGSEVREQNKVVGYYAAREGRNVIYVIPVAEFEQLSKAKF